MAAFQVPSSPAPPVLSAMVPGMEERNAALLAAIRARRVAAPLPGIAPRLGGWRSSPDLHVWAADAVAPVLDAARALATGATAGHTGGWDVAMCAGTVTRPGEGNRPHRHYDAAWVCVYYVDPGGEGPDTGGELELFNPPALVRPEPGLLVVFPIETMHLVRRHRGVRERVSVAFNLAPAGGGGA